MFRKQLMRQSRAVSQSLRYSSQLHRSQFSSATFSSSHYLTTIPPRIGRRWQSTEAEKKEEAPPASAEAAKPEETVKEDPMKIELEKKNKEIVDLKDKYLRSVADYRNLQDRSKRDMDAAKQFAIQRFATDLLDSIDNLDRALISVPEAALAPASPASKSSAEAPSSEGTTTTATTPNQDLLNLHSGLKMTESILLSSLKKHGLERFDPMEGEGRKFDPNLDEATFFTKVEGKEDGEVFYTQSKGFRLNGRVIRAAKVGVVKNS